MANSQPIPILHQMDRCYSSSAPLVAMPSRLASITFDTHNNTNWNATDDTIIVAPSLLLVSLTPTPPDPDEYPSWQVHTALYPLLPIIYPYERTAHGWSVPGCPPYIGAPKQKFDWYCNRNSAPVTALHTMRDGRQCWYTICMCWSHVIWLRVSSSIITAQHSHGWSAGVG